jgi:hypothetical protein
MFEAINEAVHRTACDDLSNVREITSRTSKVATVRRGWEHRTVYAFNDGQRRGATASSTSDREYAGRLHGRRR